MVRAMRLPCSVREWFTQLPLARSPVELLLIAGGWRSMNARRLKFLFGGFGWNLSGLFGLLAKLAGSLRDSRSCAGHLELGCVGGQGLSFWVRWLSVTLWIVNGTGHGEGAAKHGGQPAITSSAAVCVSDRDGRGGSAASITVPPGHGRLADQRLQHH